MKFIGNIIWLIFGGLELGLVWFLAGLLLCITILGIPLGMQAFKLAGFTIWPFGREIITNDMGTGQLVGNMIWILFFGWELAICHLVLGILYYITIIGIPFGKQHLKLARLAFLPFGAEVSYIG